LAAKFIRQAGSTDFNSLKKFGLPQNERLESLRKCRGEISSFIFLAKVPWRNIIDDFSCESAVAKYHRLYSLRKCRGEKIIVYISCESAVAKKSSFIFLAKVNSRKIIVYISCESKFTKNHRLYFLRK
jgi:hypothetical protein